MTIPGERVVLPGLQVVREGRLVPFLSSAPTHSSATPGWAGVAFEDYSVPALLIPRHEHVENFLHVVVRGSVRYEVRTGGRTLRFDATPGTTFVIPRRTVDEVLWAGETRRIAVAIHPTVLRDALDETAGGREVELTEHWNLMDRPILSALLAMKADLEEGSPVGPLYGESLVDALAVYLVRRYATTPVLPASYRGGLPGYRLRRVLDFIEANLGGEICLADLASLAGMSPHYFLELFARSTGRTPHRYVLLRRVESAKRALRRPGTSVADAGLSAGFKNPAHFARTFRKFVGTTPSRFRQEMGP